MAAPATSSQADVPHTPVNPRTRLIVSTSVAAAAFLLYVSCLAPTVTYTGDCGELIAASYRLGIAHPSGYPLYCLLGRVFASLVPVGEVGWRYNLLSAVFGAVTVGLVTASVHRLTAVAQPQSPTAESPTGSPLLLAGHWPAIGAGLLLAGFTYLGTQCVIAEVYALHAMMLAALFYCAIAWHQDADWRWLYTLALLFGLELNVHLSCVYLVPGLFLYVVYQHRSRFQAARNAKIYSWAVMLALVTAAFSLNLYLPLRAGVFPELVRPGVWWPMDWGHPADWDHWLAHVTARQYRHYLFRQPADIVLGKLIAFLGFLVLQFFWSTPLVIWGAFRAWRREPSAPTTGGRWLGAALLLTAVFNIAVHINYDVGDLSNFFFPAYIVMAIWMGFGLQALFQAATRRGERMEAAAPGSPWRWRLHTVTWLGLIGTVAVQWGTFVPAASWRGETQARDAALERAAAAENLIQQNRGKPSLLLLMDDALWGFWYAQFVLGRAKAVDTPWGVWRHKIVEANRLVFLVDELQRKGPVALSQWDARTDQRYPYVMLTNSGNLCLASHRKLPPPATRLDSGSQQGRLHPGGIISARFRRSRLNRGDSDDLQLADLSDLTPEELQSLTKAGPVALKREELAAFEVDFAGPFPAPNAAPLALDTAGNGAHAGWIEVLIARRGHLPGLPSPRQGNYEIPAERLSTLTKTMPPLLVFKQTRRLVVPLDVVGAKVVIPLRASVPIQMEGDAPLGLYDVWTRLTRTPNDVTTPWKRTDLISISNR